MSSTAKFDSLIDSFDDAWAAYMDPDRETQEQRTWQAAFFEELRSEFGSLSETAVENLKTLVFCHRTFWADSPLPYLAWFLGNIRNEVGANMAPIKETQRGNEASVSDAQVVARLDAWWKSGRARQKGVKSRYWRSNAAYPFGRGYFQTTWHDNYVKTRAAVREVTGVDIPFDDDYSLMMDPLASAIGGFAMALKGRYTGKALVDYLGDDGAAFDYRNARAVVNGDAFNFDRVARFCRQFETALVIAEKKVPGWLATPPRTEPEAVTESPMPTPPIPEMPPRVTQGAQSVQEQLAGDDASLSVPVHATARDQVRWAVAFAHEMGLEPELHIHLHVAGGQPNFPQPAEAGQTERNFR